MGVGCGCGCGCGCAAVVLSFVRGQVGQWVFYIFLFSFLSPSFLFGSNVRLGCTRPREEGDGTREEFLGDTGLDYSIPNSILVVHPTVSEKVFQFNPLPSPYHLLAD